MRVFRHREDELLARFLRSHQAFIPGGVACALIATAALAADGAPVNMGIPDLSSGGISWDLDNPFYDSNSAFLKIPGDPGPGPVVQHPDFPYDGDTTRRMADTSNPILQSSVKEAMDAEVARVMEGGIPFVPTSRCWPGGVPGLHVYTSNNFYLQTEDQVWILNMRGEVRRIYLNVGHSGEAEFSWYGESVGHYEGDGTLVIDTIYLDDKGPIDRLNTPHSRALHVQERHTLTDDGNRMRITFNVSDPGVFTQTWNAMVEHARDDGEWIEYVCNENSVEYFIPEDELVPVPSATRRDF
jgi:hypothetical protein